MEERIERIKTTQEITEDLNKESKQIAKRN